MFGYYCIIAACFLAGLSHKKYSFIAYAVFAEFLLHKLAYNHLFLDFRAENKWFIYLIYASIQLPIIYYLYKLKSHFLITLLIFINMVYNLILPFAYFYEKLIYIYYAKDMFIGTIMILELIYLGWLCSYVRYVLRNNIDDDLNRVDRLFRVRTNFCFRCIP